MDVRGSTVRLDGVDDRHVVTGAARLELEGAMIRLEEQADALRRALESNKEARRALLAVYKARFPS